MSGGEKCEYMFSKSIPTRMLHMPLTPNTLLTSRALPVAARFVAARAPRLSFLPCHLLLLLRHLLCILSLNCEWNARAELRGSRYRGPEWVKAFHRDRFEAMLTEPDAMGTVSKAEEHGFDERRRSRRLCSQ